MKLYPAIDLRGGQAVRLYQGDYDQMTVYNADPAAQAREFIAAGAKYLHVVDLDGANLYNILHNHLQDISDYHTMDEVLFQLYDYPIFL